MVVVILRILLGKSVQMNCLDIYGKGIAADKNGVAMTAVHALQHYGINTVNLHQMKQEIQVYT